MNKEEIHVTLSLTAAAKIHDDLCYLNTFKSKATPNFLDALSRAIGNFRPAEQLTVMPITGPDI